MRRADDGVDCRGDRRRERRMTAWWRPLLLGVAVLCGASALHAVRLAPTLVVLTSPQRTAPVTLVNPGRDTMRVALSLAYGPWETDSAGRAAIRLRAPGPDDADAAPWLSVQPASLAVPPGGRATAMVRADPPAGLAAGEYGMRLVVTSEPVEGPRPAATEQVQPELALVVSQTIPVRFREGRVRTAVTIRSGRAIVQGDSAVVTLDLAHQGAAWIGTATLTLVDSRGADLTPAVLPLMIERSGRRRLAAAFPPPVPPVSQVRVRLETAREGLPARVLLQAPPATIALPVKRP